MLTMSFAVADGAALPIDSEIQFTIDPRDMLLFNPVDLRRVLPSG
jgi:hypothetical protein